MKFLKSLYINNRFFYVLAGLVILFIVSFLFPVIFGLVKGLLIVLILVWLVDIYLLYGMKQGIQAQRILPERLSNGDLNPVWIQVQNQYSFPIDLRIIDEIPIQFQSRNFGLKAKMSSRQSAGFPYELRPVERGQYEFGRLNIYVSGILGLISRRFVFDQGAVVPTYPSFLQMRQYELMAFSHSYHQHGLKKIRKVGQSAEFDQIRDYVRGDDVRHINWKATARKTTLMVNQYQDERAQPIYSIIDQGRVMKMPFRGLSLLDYAINATLALSNIALLKHDKAGMLSFSNKVEHMVAAERRNAQMQLILESLYHLNTNFMETDFGRLYAFVKAKMTHRSLLMVYTNFETMDALNRQLRYLKALSRLHLVVVIFFKNAELDTLLESHAHTVPQIYDKAIAEKFDYEKRLITAELRKYGIHTVLTRPEDLTADTINKYLEFKSRGLF